LSGMFVRGILIFWLVVSLVLLSALSAPRITPSRLVSQHVGPVARAPRELASETPMDVAKASATRTTRRRRHAVARAVERRLLVVASRTRLLARFVDRSTGSLESNVSAHCDLISRRYQRQRRFVYLCQVWQHPDPASSGVKVRVLCPIKHKRFVVMAYHRSHR
jgi:hypothetical protein